MCGRFYTDEELMNYIAGLVRQMDRQMAPHKSGDVYPSQMAAVIMGRNQGLYAQDMRWGLPSYQGGKLMINARAETALERKSFSDGIQHRRCVIPAGFFYEWDRDKNKVSFLYPDRSPICMAGFYQMYEDGGHFIILTTRANASISPVHHRMPLILDESEITDWIFDNGSVRNILAKVPPMLRHEQEYEQLSFI